MSKRILIINPFGIGDVLFSTPLVPLLKKGFPGSHIGYICNIRTEEILETNPDIDEVFVFERDEYRALWKNSKTGCIKKLYRFWHEIHKRRFDIAIDLSLGKEYAFFCWLSGIRERRGFDYKGRGRFLTHKIQFNGFNDKPVTEYYLDLLPCGILPCAESISPILLSTYGDKEYIDSFLKEAGIGHESLLVGIAPGGGISFGDRHKERRRWPARKFGKLADRIIEKFRANVVLMWGPEEEGLVKEIGRLMKERPVIAPKTTIRQMACLSKRCKLVICSEGGPLHIASSQNVKTVSIFGPVDEKVYGAYPPGGNNTVITSSAGCRPCYRHFRLPDCDTKECIDTITVDEVFDTIVLKELL